MSMLCKIKRDFNFKHNLCRVEGERQWIVQIRLQLLPTCARMTVVAVAVVVGERRKWQRLKQRES